MTRRFAETPTSRDTNAPAAAVSLIICFSVIRCERSAIPATQGWQTAERIFPAATSAPMPVGVTPRSNKKTEAYPITAQFTP